MPTEPRYELALVRPRLAPTPAAAERGSLVPRAVLAAALSPVLTYWLPSRATPRLAESGLVTEPFLFGLLIGAMALLGAYLAVVVAMRARRISELAPPVTPLEEMLVVLLGAFLPTAPWLLGFGMPLTQSLVLQAPTVFLAILALGGVLGDGRRAPILVRGARVERETLVRAIVAGLLPTVILLALLPAVVAAALADVFSSDTPADPSTRVLMLWAGATVLGVVAGIRGWPTGKPPLVGGLALSALAAGATVLSVVVWSAAGGLAAPGAVFLIQPVATVAAVLLLAARPERAIDTPSPVAAAVPVVRPLADPLLVPSAGSTFLGRSETPHQNTSTGRRERRIEARWLVPRPFAMVTADYRGRDGLEVRKETPTELMLSRGGPSPAAVRLVARDSRTEVSVRVAIPD